MKQPDIYQITTDRLKKYRLFSDETIETVAKTAKKQASYQSYRDFFEDAGIPVPTLYITKKKTGVPVVDIPSKVEPSKGTIVVHLPMANPLDPNQLYQIATIVAVNPAYRVVAFGNPSGIPNFYRQQNLSLRQRIAIAFTNNIQALVAAELEYLNAQNIDNSYHVGYSYGALKTLISSYYAKPGVIKGMILVDPVAHSRGFKQLVENFQATLGPLGEYVNRTMLESYFEARKDTSESARQPRRGLVRQINIAIGLLLARIDFINFFEKVLERHPDVSATVAWGSKSELGNDAHLKANLYNLVHSKYEVHSMRLEGDKHAMANDVHLYAAIIKEALSKA